MFCRRLSARLPEWGGSDVGFQSVSRIPIVIVNRPLPDRMPVVKWGLGGTEGVVKEIPRLKKIGFTHCLGLRCNYQQVWDDGARALPGSAEDVRDSHEMLSVALENDIRIVASLSPGRWLRTAAAGKPFLRIDRKGEHYGREDISGLFPQVQDFVFNTGAAMSRAYGDHKALSAALLHTEVRGESQVSFHPIEIEAYRKATGAEIPAEVTIKNGVRWETLADFPKNRVIADDHPRPLHESEYSARIAATDSRRGAALGANTDEDSRCPVRRRVSGKFHFADVCSPRNVRLESQLGRRHVSRVDVRAVAAPSSLRRIAAFR